MGSHTVAVNLPLPCWLVSLVKCDWIGELQFVLWQATEAIMRNPSDDELIQRLVSILAAGFNRSMCELEEAGAIDTRKLRKAYMPGSKLYELVTEQLVHTATCGARGIRELFESDSMKSE